MEISVWLVIVFTISALLNVVFFWLLKEQSKRLSVVADNSSDLIELISSFSNHVKAVYSFIPFMEMRHEGLMAHRSCALLEEQYGELADLAEQIEYEEEIEEDAEEEIQKEQHVFYAGTRESNS